MEKWKTFLNKGTKTAVFFKKAVVILLLLLAAFGIGYCVGTLLSNFGL